MLKSVKSPPFLSNDLMSHKDTLKFRYMLKSVKSPPFLSNDLLDLMSHKDTLNLDTCSRV